MADTPDPPVAKPGGGDYRGLAMLGVVVAEMVICTMLGVWYDKRNGTEPWGALGGAVAGVFFCFIQAIRLNRLFDEGKPRPPENRDS